MPTRQSSHRIELRGIFVGAKVCRGPDWEWGQQDGGDGKTGRVMEIRGWDNESCRSVANVSWVSGSTNVYRLGHKGNVDLKYLQPAVGGAYYRDHMPVLGQPEEQQQQPLAMAAAAAAAAAVGSSSSGTATGGTTMPPAMRSQTSAALPQFAVGDIVRVCLEREALMHLQQGHGGWNPRMAEYLGKVGTVHRITDKGDIRVQYDGCANRWTFHPAALVKVCTFHVGDVVQIIGDVAKVQQLQKGHGEWVDTMLAALNKLGKVIKVYADGDLRIQQIDDGFAWTLNPKCVKLERSTLVSSSAGGGGAGAASDAAAAAAAAAAGTGAPAVTASTERSNSMMDLSHQRADPVMMPPLSGLSGSSAADKLVREAAQGRIEYVQQHLAAHPADVDAMSAGKTCLQVAAHQGHQNLVVLLLRLNANVNVVDKEGDSTLHYAAFGNQPEIMRVLLNHGADINVLNASHCSALHISAHKRPPHCVQVLLEYGADVNAQDSYGDTALHDAIGKDNTDVVDLLCAAPALNLTVRNNRGFNALHHAALKGNVAAARRILGIARHLVDVKKDDSFAALHLAALNGHAAMVEVLVRDGQADIDVRNNRLQTPFLLAVSQGHAAAVERLVQLGCDVRARDEDGDNAMHLCVIKKSNLVQEIPRAEAPQIWEIYGSLEQQPQIVENRLMCAILCYLLRSGCRIEANNKGKNILDWVWDKASQELILSYAQGKQPGGAASVSASGAAAAAGGSNADGGVDASGASTSAGANCSEQQIYSNILAMNLSDTANNGLISLADSPGRLQQPVLFQV